MTTFTNMFILNQLKDKLCSLCLSQNRYFVSNLPVLERVVEYFPNLLLDFDINEVKTCWECDARLKQLLRFHKQVQMARQTLEQVVNSAGEGYYMPVMPSLSRLGRRKLINTKCKPVSTVTSGNNQTFLLQKETTSVDVKKEIDPLDNHENSNAVTDSNEVPITQNYEDFIKKEPITDELIDNCSSEASTSSYNYKPVTESKESDRFDKETSKCTDLNEVEQNSSTKQKRNSILDLDEIISSMVVIKESTNEKTVYTENNIAQNISVRKIIIPIKKNMLQKPKQIIQKTPTLHSVRNQLNLQPKTHKPQTLKVYSLQNKNELVNTNEKKMLILNKKPVSSENKIPIVNSSLSLEEQRSFAENQVKKVRISKDIVLQLREKEKEYISNIKTGFNCEQCIFNIENEAEFKKHMEKHEPSAGLFKCDICMLRFEDKDSLISHHQNHFIAYSCIRCPRNTFLCRLWSTMSLHLEIHKNPGWLPCDHCGLVYPTKEKLKEHVDSTHRIHCPICANKKFRTQETLDIHNRKWHEDLECEKCHVKVKGSIFLRHHMRSDVCRTRQKVNETTGEIGGQAYCGECNKYFNSFASLMAHMSSSKAHSHREAKYICDICKKSFLQKSIVAQHIAAVHDKITLPCLSCDKRFSVKSHLRMHVRRVHLGEREERIPCHVCGKTFATKAVLANHLVIHTGERPYQCHMCEWDFVQKSTLRTHIRLKHNKDKVKPSGVKNKGGTTPRSAKNKGGTTPSDIGDNNIGENIPSDVGNMDENIPSDVAKMAENIPCDVGEIGKNIPSDVGEIGENIPCDVGEIGENIPCDVGEMGENIPCDVGEMDENIPCDW